MADSIKFAAFALPYVALAALKPYPLSWLLKLLPLAYLACLAFARGRGSGRAKMPGLWWAGLGLAAAGDVLLDLDRHRYLEAGIAVFSAAYLLYAAEFWKRARAARAAYARAACVAIYVAAFAAMLFPGAGDLRVPVVLYALVLANLGISASFAARSGLRGRLGFVGACSLILSDTLIGLQEFGAGFAVPRALVIVTYYFGQWAIARSFFYARH